MPNTSHQHRANPAPLSRRKVLRTISAYEGTMPPEQPEQARDHDSETSPVNGRTAAAPRPAARTRATGCAGRRCGRRSNRASRLTSPFQHQPSISARGRAEAEVAAVRDDVHLGMDIATQQETPATPQQRLRHARRMPIGRSPACACPGVALPPASGHAAADAAAAPGQRQHHGHAEHAHAE